MKEERSQQHLEDLDSLLRGIDFSQDSDREGIYQKTLTRMNDRHRGGKPMKGLKGFSQKFVGVAAALTITIVGVSLVQPSFSQSIYQKIIDLGHIVGFISQPAKGPLPEYLQGKLYNAQGELIDAYELMVGTEIYNAAGERVYNIDQGGNLITVPEEDQEDDKLVVKDVEQIQGYTSFEVKLPSYLPEGYQFDRAEFYREKEGVSPDYVNIIFVQRDTGKTLFMQQRVASEDTAYSFDALEGLEKVEVGTSIGILSDDKNLDWEYNGVLYGLSTKGNISREEILRIGKSIF